MTWVDMKIAFNELQKSANSNKNNVKIKWKKFEKIAIEVSKNPPIALDNLTLSIKKVSKGNKNITVLDHGCGGGLKAFYFVALGFKNIFGVNVNYDVNYLNTILKKVFNIKEKRFYTTDGKKLPFQSSKFNFIFSLQVLEHLSDSFIDKYYSEEERVLKKKGYVYHEVPHILVPFESHSRLWFAHWLPTFIQPIAYGVLKTIQLKENKLRQGKEIARKFNGDFVKLRTPSYHYKKIQNHFGNFTDMTVERLIKKTDFRYYDKDNPVQLRKLLYFIFRLPFIGYYFAKFCKYFFMLQTLAQKTNN